MDRDDYKGSLGNVKQHQEQVVPAAPCGDRRYSVDNPREMLERERALAEQIRKKGK